ncbi:MAG: hypothetical protein IKW62_05000 [Clostridia bacterium]|nr:hypothetical protein [Clostridia bacterium]
MDKGIDEKKLISRANDIAGICERQYIPKAIGFLTPAETAILKRNFKKSEFSPDLTFCFSGGFPDAERQMFFALPEYAVEDFAQEFVTVLEITGRDISTLNHRDFLGSLLGLGIKREKIGDILCLSGKCLVFATADIADYIVNSLDKVGRCGVKVKKADPQNLEIPKRAVQEIRTTVAALRLDCIIGAALKTSRSGAADIIRSKRVSVNWLETDDSAFKLKGGDVFSVRGAGRFRLTEDINETRKGRLGICIEKSV